MALLSEQLHLHLHLQLHENEHEYEHTGTVEIALSPRPNTLSRTSKSVVLVDLATNSHWPMGLSSRETTLLFMNRFRSQRHFASIDNLTDQHLLLIR